MTETLKQRNSGFRADSLWTGMLVMLLLTVFQRGVGFVRGIWFCRLLEDAVLGQWAMAFGFITLVTPMILFGIPGSLPRFVETYRLRGQLGGFLRRLVLTTGVCGAAFFLVLLVWPAGIGWLVFLEPQSTPLIYSVGVAVLSIIAFNFVNDLIASLRLVRMVSIMQTIQTVAFTVLAIVWLQNGGGLTGVILVYAISNVLAMIPGMFTLVVRWEPVDAASEPLDTKQMWRRLLPYAAAIWAMNLLSNTFELADRSMLLHLSPGGDLAGQAAVGQYHSGRIFPALLLSLASMLSGVFLPYLTADWESGNSDAVQRRLRQCLVLVTLVFTLGAATTQLFSHFIFHTLLEDRYNDGLAVMPMAFVFTIWASIVTIGQNYLWVLEKGKWIALVMGVGLAMNLGLNYWWVPRLGLTGAVWATLVSYLVILVGVWLSMRRFGYAMDSSVVYCTLLPTTLLIGPYLSLAMIILVTIVSDETRSVYRLVASTWLSRFRPQPAGA